MRSLVPSPPMPMREWAYRHIVLPHGPHAGGRLCPEAQPVSDLILRELDRDPRRVCIVAPAQSGKSLVGWAIPLLYWAIERASPVAAGLPTKRLMVERWDGLLRPIIESSPELAPCLPVAGKRGGLNYQGDGYVVLNGAGSIYPLTGVGNDKARASITARVLCATETDGYAGIRAVSPESEPLTQMRARLLAHGEMAREYYECTVSTEDGFIWRSYTEDSTQGVVEHRCPYCRQYVRVGRQDLHGWRDADSEDEAAASAYYACPACGARWSERDRRQSLLDGRIVHERPDAGMLGVRYTAAQNMLLSAGYVAREEWICAKRGTEGMRRRLAQQLWAEPPPPPPDCTIEVRSDAAVGLPRGVVPAGAERVYVGVDCGRNALHWTAIAPLPDGAVHVLAYGVHRTGRDGATDAEIVYTGLRRLSMMVSTGWIREDGTAIKTRAVFVDASWQPGAVREACRALGWIPCNGRSATTYRCPPYRAGRPRVRSGEGWHVTQNYGVTHSADMSKAALHDLVRAGRLKLFGHPEEHAAFMRHLSAEVARQTPAGYTTYHLIAKERDNHWLDASALAVLAWRVDDPAGSDPLREARLLVDDAVDQPTGEQQQQPVQRAAVSAKPPRAARHVRRIIRGSGGWI